jgi:hypothetical protein
MYISVYLYICISIYIYVIISYLYILSVYIICIYKHGELLLNHHETIHFKRIYRQTMGLIGIVDVDIMV